jgi:hypothetical protein
VATGGAIRHDDLIVLPDAASDTFQIATIEIAALPQSMGS